MNENEIIVENINELDSIKFEDEDSSQTELDTEEDSSDEDEALESDLEEGPSNRTRPNKEEKKEKGPLKILTKLTAQFKGLMGEANLRFARGDTETAQKMCYEVIRQQPNAWEPYLTLAQIFETDPHKCKGYLTIASYLNPGNTSTWCRLAEISLEEGNKREAVGFYSRCLSRDRMNFDVHRKRLKLAKELGDDILIYRFQESLISKLPAENYEEIIEIASTRAKLYHKEKKYVRARNILQVPFCAAPQHITPDLVNMMLELLILTGEYAQCLDIFVDFCNFTFEIVVLEDGVIHINDYAMPENISIDLKTKFIICSVKLKCFEVVNALIDLLVIEEDVEVVGDLYLDICEALIGESKHDMALKLFVPLKKSKNFSLAGVWLKYSDCLVAVGLKEQAIEGYFTVITLAPQHIEVLRPLAELLLEMNKKQEALDVMAYQTTERLNVGVLIMRLKLLKQIGDLKEYWKCVELLLSRHCAVLKHFSEIKTALTVGRAHDKIVRIQKLRDFRNNFTDVIPNQDVVCIMEPSAEKEYELFKEIFAFALESKSYSQMQKLGIMAYTSKKFEKYSDEIALLALLGCLYNGDLHHGYYLAKESIVKYPYNNFLWNIFNLFAVYGDSRFNKFVYRLRMRILNHEAYDILDANMDFYFSNYNSALKFFIKEFKETKAPYISFILGVLTLHMSTVAKTVDEDNKTQLGETTTYLFLYYGKNRSKLAAQEVFFNLGRMYHQLGLLYLAEHYYKKVLEVRNELLDEHPDVLCLKYEAAYNLHVIYKKSGNFKCARNILMKHLVI